MTENHGIVNDGGTMIVSNIAIGSGAQIIVVHPQGNDDDGEDD